MDEQEEETIADHNAEINESYEDNATPNTAATVLAVIFGIVGTVAGLLFYAQYEQQVNPYATNIGIIPYLWLVISLVGFVGLLIKSKRSGENYRSSPWFQHYDYSLKFYLAVFLMTSFFTVLSLLLRLGGQGFS